MKITEMRKRKLTQEEQINANLIEIFNFYAKQHIKRNMKFEELEKMMRNLDQGEFSCFCRDFKITLPKIKLAEIFRKVSNKNQDIVLELDQFKEAILILG